MTDPQHWMGHWLVARKRDTEPWEVWAFDRYDHAALHFDACQQQWSTVYFARVAHCEGHPLDVTPLIHEMSALLIAQAAQVETLKQAIRDHRNAKADDRCIDDDDRLYAVLGDGIKCDRRVGDKAAMLANCARFIDKRCEGGGWRSYVELEHLLETVTKERNDWRDLCDEFGPENDKFRDQLLAQAAQLETVRQLVTNWRDVAVAAEHRGGNASTLWQCADELDEVLVHTFPPPDGEP